MVALTVAPGAAFDATWSCVARYWAYPAAESVLVGEPPCGPTVEKSTVRPEPMAIAVVMSVVSAALAVVAGVAYVLETVPLSVRPVPKAPAVWAQSPAEIVVNVPEKTPYWYFVYEF